jgi:predicted DNA-binding transcriptional regulator AlpA
VCPIHVRELLAATSSPETRTDHARFQRLGVRPLLPRLPSYHEQAPLDDNGGAAFGPARVAKGRVMKGNLAKPLLSVTEVAILLGEERSTVYRSIQRGGFPLPVITINGQMRVARLCRGESPRRYPCYGTNG